VRAAIAVARFHYEHVWRIQPRFEHALDWEMCDSIASKFPFFYEPKNSSLLA